MLYMDREVLNMWPQVFFAEYHDTPVKLTFNFEYKMSSLHHNPSWHLCEILLYLAYELLGYSPKSMCFCFVRLVTFDQILISYTLKPGGGLCQIYIYKKIP